MSKPVSSSQSLSNASAGTGCDFVNNVSSVTATAMTWVRAGKLLVKNTFSMRKEEEKQISARNALIVADDSNGSTTSTQHTDKKKSENSLPTQNKLSNKDTNDRFWSKTQLKPKGIAPASPKTATQEICHTGSVTLNDSRGANSALDPVVLNSDPPSVNVTGKVDTLACATGQPVDVIKPASSYTSSATTRQDPSLATDVTVFRQNEWSPAHRKDVQGHKSGAPADTKPGQRIQVVVTDYLGAAERVKLVVPEQQGSKSYTVQLKSPHKPPPPARYPRASAPALSIEVSSTQPSSKSNLIPRKTWTIPKHTNSLDAEGGLSSRPGSVGGVSGLSSSLHAIALEAVQRAGLIESRGAAGLTDITIPPQPDSLLGGVNPQSITGRALDLNMPLAGQGHVTPTNTSFHLGSSLAPSGGLSDKLSSITPSTWDRSALASSLLMCTRTQSQSSSGSAMAWDSQGTSLSARTAHLFADFDLDPRNLSDNNAANFLGMSHGSPGAGQHGSPFHWFHPLGKGALKGALFNGAASLGLSHSLLAKDHMSLGGTLAQRPAGEGSTGGSTADNLELQQVQVFFRHGARTPIYVMPGAEEAEYRYHDIMHTVPHAERYRAKLAHVKDGKPPSKKDFIKDPLDFLKGGVQFGQLTSVGKDQAFRLGKILKQAYVDEKQFIGTKYDPGAIYARSSLVNRTIQTLECLMAGLYDPDTVKDVKIHFSKHTSEILYPNNFACPLLNFMSADANANRRKYIKAYDDVEQKILQTLKTTSADFAKHLEQIPIEEVYDDITCRRTHGLAVPRGLDTLYGDIIAVAAKHNVNVFTGYKTPVSGSPESSELRQTGLQVAAGPLFKMIQDNLKRGTYGRSEKMFLYAIHDSTIISLLAGLSETALEENWPPFCADLRIELYKDTADRHYVRALYLGKPLSLDSENKGEHYVTLDRFGQLIQPYVTDERLYKEKCHLGMKAFADLVKKAVKAAEH